MKKIKAFISFVMVLLMVGVPVMSVSAAGYSQTDMFEGTSIKGMQGARSNKNYGGIEHSLINFYLDDVIKDPTSEWATAGFIAPYEFEGETFYFGGDLPGWGFVEIANRSEMSISAVFLLRKKVDAHGSDSSFLIDPESNVDGYTYYAPNADLSTYGGRAIRAYWHFLMEKMVAEGSHIDNFILGNEVNMPNHWHYSGADGNPDADSTATKYANAFYHMWSAVRKYTTVSRCSVSLDHSWQHNDEGRGIAAKDFLHIFNDRLAALNGGKSVDWSVSAHLYPAILYDTNIWEDPHGLTPNDSSARFVDGSNLWVMTNYIRDVFGEEHRVMLTEQGFCDEHGADVQAASLAYTYYAAMHDPMVDNFLLNTENAGYAAGGQSLNFNIKGTLAEQVYTKIDNGNAADQQWIADLCLPIIGVDSWEEIIPNFNGSGSGYDLEDYADVFNAEYYYNYNGDLQGAVENDPQVLLKHFVERGMSEGRVGSAEFDINVYKEKNGDLVAAFGNDNVKYYEHYIACGKAEGREAAVAGGTVVPGGNSEISKYAAVFDAEYYYNHNSDLQGALGNNSQDLFNHFKQWGMNEGRVGSAEFDINVYKEKNGDLVAAFGNDNVKYYEHYIAYGKNEGRVASAGGTTVPDAGNSEISKYAAVFDAEYYYNNNSDLQSALENTPQVLFNHFKQCGMSEGRVASAEFDINVYKNNYSDLVAAFGDDNVKYYEHYIACGKAENREAAAVGSGSTAPGGSDGSLDYAEVFDAAYYANANGDLKAAFGDDADMLYAHFLSWGMAEGRVASAEFNVNVYKNANGDLQAAFGDDFVKYFEHYIQCGKDEGRTCK